MWLLAVVLIVWLELDGVRLSIDVVKLKIFFLDFLSRNTLVKCQGTMSKPILITIYYQHDRFHKSIISVLDFSLLIILERNYGTWGQVSICFSSNLKINRTIFANYDLRPIRQVDPFSGGEVCLESLLFHEWLQDWRDLDCLPDHESLF